MHGFIMGPSWTHGGTMHGFVVFMGSGMCLLTHVLIFARIDVRGTSICALIGPLFHVMFILVIIGAERYLSVCGTTNTPHGER